MPRAGDLSLLGSVGLPMDRNPLQRISYQPAKSVFDLDALLEQVETFVVDFLFPAIEELTGIDLSAFLPILDGTVGALTTLFGDLNPTSGTFNPLDAVTTFIELMVEVGANLPLALIEELAGFSGGVPILSQLIGLFTGTTGGLTGLSGLGSIFGDLTGLLGNPTALGSGTPILGSAGTIPLLGPLITGLLNGGQGVNTLNLFGQLPSSIFGIIPASSIGGQSPNLLNNPGFDGAISMDGSGVWVWDAADGYNGNGCASTTADGTLKALLSNAVDVQQGQTINASIRAKTVSYTGTGTPIRLMLRTYLDGAQVSTVDIQSVAGAGLTTFTQLSGSYTIPAGVDQVRLRPVVDTTATGGTVKFDFGELTRPGNGPFDGILDLFGLSALDDLFGGLDVNAIWSQIISLIINPLGLLDAEGVPIIGDILDIFGGATDTAGAGTFFDDLLGLLGNPTDVGTGSPSPNPIDRIPIVGGLLNGLFGGFTGILDQDANQTAVGEAAEGIADAQAGTNAMVLQIAAALGSGTTDSEDFEFSNGSSWGTNWRVMKSAGGTASVDGHNGVFSAGFGNDEEIIALRLLKQASGDFQTVSVGQSTASGAITDGNAAVDLWLRCTNFTTYATATGLRMRFWANKSLELHWFNSGTPTLIASGTSSVNYSATSTLAFESGQGLVANRYLAKVNNTPVLDFTDVTSRGLGNTYRGVGLRGEFSLLFFPPLEMQPAKLKQWTATG